MNQAEKKNKEIREAAAASGLYLWEVAELLGMSETKFNRLMRHEFSPEERERVLAAIAEGR